jgi:hypothetical protein
VRVASPLAISVASITIGGELGCETLADETYLRLLRDPAPPYLIH